MRGRRRKIEEGRGKEKEGSEVGGGRWVGVKESEGGREREIFRSLSLHTCVFIVCPE